jgi:hypothetical protein
MPRKPLVDAPQRKILQQRNSTDNGLTRTVDIGTLLSPPAHATRDQIFIDPLLRFSPWLIDFIFQ